MSLADVIEADVSNKQRHKLCVRAERLFKACFRHHFTCRRVHFFFCSSHRLPHSLHDTPSSAGLDPVWSPAQLPRCVSRTKVFPTSNIENVIRASNTWPPPPEANKTISEIQTKKKEKNHTCLKICSSTDEIGNNRQRVKCLLYTFTDSRCFPCIRYVW